MVLMQDEHEPSGGASSLAGKVFLGFHSHNGQRVANV